MKSKIASFGIHIYLFPEWVVETGRIELTSSIFSAGYIPSSTRVELTSSIFSAGLYPVMV
jgi:hypothetical protein